MVEVISLKISTNSFVLLKECVNKHKPEDIELLNKIDSLDEHQYNELREVVCDELIMYGFEGDRILPYGELLEQLIDDIGDLFMK